MTTYSAVLGLGHHEVDDASLDETPDHENEVALPLDVLQSNGEAELVDKRADADEQAGEGHALGTHLEGEDFDGVESLHGRPAERIDSLEDVDEGHSGGAGRFGVSAGLDAGCGRYRDPANTTADIDPDEKRTAADLVDETGADGGDNDLNGVHGDEEVGLRNSARDTSGIENTGQEVGDGTCNPRVSS